MSILLILFLIYCSYSLSGGFMIGQSYWDATHDDPPTKMLNARQWAFIHVVSGPIWIICLLGYLGGKAIIRALGNDSTPPSSP